jgi:hypothetical protein
MEANYYYDARRTRIGAHGDGERVVVLGTRLGHAAVPLWFRWFLKSKAVGESLAVPLSPGDVYVMSEKAVGTDWKKRNVLTLRHWTEFVVV